MGDFSQGFLSEDGTVEHKRWKRYLKSSCPIPILLHTWNYIRSIEIYAK